MVQTIYLAARFSQRPCLRGYARELRELGYRVNASWLDEESPPGQDSDVLADTDTLDAYPYGFLQERALVSAEDVKACDVCIVFAGDPQTQPTRGGSHVEFGMAYAMGKRVIVCGECEHIFHRLPYVEVLSDWETVKKALLCEPLGAAETGRWLFQRVWGKGLQINARKSAGYSPGDDPWRNFQEAEAFGVPAWIGVLIRLMDKVMRVKSLSRQHGQRDSVPESITQTLIDLAVYAVIAICVYARHRQAEDQGEPFVLRELDA